MPGRLDVAALADQRLEADGWLELDRRLDAAALVDHGLEESWAGSLLWRGLSPPEMDGQGTWSYAWKGW